MPIQITTKINLTGKEAAFAFVKERRPKNVKKNRTLKYNEDGSIKSYDLIDIQDFAIKKTTFKNIIFKGDFHGIEFNNCNFIDCDFDGIWGFFLIYTKCKFYKCHFRYSRYSHIEFAWDDLQFIQCHFRNIEWDEAGLYNIEFEKCTLVNFKINGAYPFGNVCFYESEIDGCQFQYINYSEKDEEIKIDEEFYDFKFSECLIADTSFNSVELRDSVFYNTSLYKCAFIECRLGADSIILDTELKYPLYASLDFQTFLKSEPINQFILQKYFRVNEGINMKEIISTITKKIEFHTVFISYSLKDKLFAERLNQALENKGIRTFIWVKDAPAGKPLEEIMSTGINKYDRVLFIASEHSIKSKACQFELSEARHKQESSWENIFFPIHIEDFLFKVQKRDIRPIVKADEYWENIEELKRINSLDFSQFNSEDVDDLTFDKAVEKLIRDLKID